MNDAASQSTPGMRHVTARIGRPVHEYLVEAYEGRELPQVEIAEELGVDPATISRWLRRIGVTTRVVGHRKRRRAA